ncbi:hypothetical protein BH20VER1_BH20VER1_15710 [soil metagenome]
MVPESESAFFEEDSDRAFRFIRNDKEQVAAMIVEPEQLTFRRLP